MGGKNVEMSSNNEQTEVRRGKKEGVDLKRYQRKREEKLIEIHKKELNTEALKAPEMLQLQLETGNYDDAFENLLNDGLHQSDTETPLDKVDKASEIAVVGEFAGIVSEVGAVGRRIKMQNVLKRATGEQLQGLLDSIEKRAGELTTKIDTNETTIDTLKEGKDRKGAKELQRDTRELVDQLAPIDWVHRLVQDIYDKKERRGRLG